MATTSAASSPVPTAGVSGKLRMLFPIALVGGFWAFLFIADRLEMTMFIRFVSRMVAYLILLLGFTGWWLTYRRVSRRDRWFTLGVMVFGLGVASLLGHPTMNAFAVLLSGLPFVFTLWTVWLLVTQKLSPRAQRIGLWVLICLTWGFFDLVRSDGLDGGQHGVFSWRWEPTAEERFLTERPRNDPHQRATVAAQPLTLQAGDWAEFRGPRRDNQVTGLRIATDWAAHPPKLLWKQRIGPAWSSMIIVDGRLFTQEQRGEEEAVVCYDAATGAEIWAHLDAERFYEGLSGAGPRGTPTFADGRLYTLGGRGRLNCLDATTGQKIWSRDIVADSAAPIPQWGFSNSPLVVDGKVVVYAGAEADKGVLAYQADTGEPAWTIAAGKNSYSSPQLASIGDSQQTLMLSTTGLTAVENHKGGVLWQYTLVGDEMFTPVVQPQAVSDSQFLIQTAAGIGLVDIAKQNDQWTATERWATKKLKPSLNDFVVHEGAIFGFDDGIFCCLDLATGERRWKGGRYGHGQVLLLKDQGLLLILSEQGEVVLLKARPDKLEELTRVPAIVGKTWNHPVIAHGRLYVRNDEEMACFELPLEQQ